MKDTLKHEGYLSVINKLHISANQVAAKIIDDEISIIQAIHELELIQSDINEVKAEIDKLDLPKFAADDIPF